MTSQTTGVTKRGFRLGFITELYAEMKKVVWLSRRDAAYLSGLVLLIWIVVGAILGVLDYGFTQLIDKVFLGG